MIPWTFLNFYETTQLFGAMITIQDLFVRIEPFRSTVLSLLCPFEISTFLQATRCHLSEWERNRYLDILDDIFEDSAIITQMVAAGMTVRIVGSDVARLQIRLTDPSTYYASAAQDFYFFVLVSDSSRDSESQSTLIRDYRQEPEYGFVPDDLSFTELQSRFDVSVAQQIAAFSRWILCAPYLAGTMPNNLPGWIPLLSTRPHMHVRTYISTYNDCNAKILYMDQDLTNKLFGLRREENLFGKLSDLHTCCIKLQGSDIVMQQLRGNVIISFLSDLLEECQRKGELQFVIAHTMYSANCSIAVELR